MVCRDEFIEDIDHNIVRQDLRLERIAARWEYHCVEKLVKWVREYNRRIDEMNAQQDAEYEMALKVHAWRLELRAVHDELKELVLRFLNGEGVRPEDWDAIAALYDEAENKRRWSYADKYHKIVQVIALRGAESRQLRKIAGNRTDGMVQETPKTANRIEYPREQSDTDQRVQAGCTAFEENTYEHVAIALQGERVLSEQWDAYAWAAETLTKWGLVVSDESKERVVQVAESIVERWHLDKGHNVGSDDAIDLTGVDFDLLNDVEDECKLVYNEWEDEYDQPVGAELEFFSPYDV